MKISLSPPETCPGAYPAAGFSRARAARHLHLQGLWRHHYRLQSKAVFLHTLHPFCTSSGASAARSRSHAIHMNRRYSRILAPVAIALTEERIPRQYSLPRSESRVQVLYHAGLVV
ncbi:hypothetical protein AURDEDRAFT_117419 [Auricularia subglabra TFB-10046 SS5]|uniref:Uncharacterized protein n=1 Tax=Auricularia subglabra (strain TFB-10046 / SS5) TaxID=717982 RepID=J0CX75_AURST|nr:hypothetical protein AURDEDRAFT_117419 [Auricularia subglabra TFB-10046 SS5]